MAPSWYNKQKKEKLINFAQDLLYSIRDLLTAKSKKINHIDNLKLKNFIELIEKNIIVKNNYKKLEKIIDEVKQTYNEILAKIKEIEEFEKHIEEFIKRIKKLSLTIKLNNTKEAKRLYLGADLLKDCLQRDLSKTEIEEYMLPIRLGYFNTKTELLQEIFNDLTSSEYFNKLLDNLEEQINYLNNLNEYLEKIFHFEPVKRIKELLIDEDIESKQTIIHRMLDNNQKNPKSLSIFILIVSISVDYNILLEIDKFYHDEKINSILSSAIFFGMKKENYFPHRKICSQIISKKIPDVKYIPLVIDSLESDNDNDINNNLFEYLEKQSNEIFQNYLSENPQLLDKIKPYYSLLLKSLKENIDEKVSLIAIENLIQFKITNEILSILHYFANCESQKLRMKSLQTLIYYKTTDKKTIDIFSKTLNEQSLEICLLGLEYIKITKNTLLIPTAISLLEKNPKQDLVEYLTQTLDCFQYNNVLFYLIDYMDSNNPQIINYIIQYIEKNTDLSNKDFKKFFNITKKILELNYNLKLRDKLFLKNYSKKYPYMKNINNKIIKKYS